MITIEEKLNVFNKLVLGQVQQEFQEKYDEINRKNNEIIEDHKKKLQKKKERIIQDYITKGKNEKNKLISQANINKKRLILTRKQEFIQRVVEGLYEKAQQFCHSNEYQKFLMGILDMLLPKFEGQNGITIYMNKSDMDRFSSIVKEKAISFGFNQENINIEVFNEEIFGGIMVFNEDKTLKMDYSINTIIEENRWLIGQKVYEALQESGDINGE